MLPMCNVATADSFYLGVEEGKALVDVLDLVHPHLAGVGLAELLPGDDLQKPHEVLPIGKVHEEIIDLKSRIKLAQ